MAVFYKAINIRDTTMNAEPQGDKNLYGGKYKMTLTHFHSILQHSYKYPMSSN